MAELDIHAMVESAYAEAERNEAGGADSSSAGGADAGGEAEAAPVQSVADAGEGGEQGGTPAPAPVDRARDATGKFTKAERQAQALKTKAAKEVAATPSTTTTDIPPPAGGDSSQTQPPAPGVTTQALRAPQSWTPAAKEKWAALPPEIQHEVNRIELDTKRTLQEAAPERRFAQEANRALQPYAQFAQSIGTTPLALAQQASQVAQQISTAPPHIAAQVLANLIRSRPDIQLDLINNHLSGEAQSQPQQFDPNAIIRQAKQEWRQEMQQERQQSLSAKYEQEVAAFESDPKNEFMVHEEHGPAIQARIAALLRADTGLPLAGAYEQAIWAHPATRAIMQKRAAAEAAKASTASTQQARLAASSVKSAPSTAASSLRTPKTDRERVEAAYDAVYGGG